uniref:CHAT domain-containing protein n=1 Tax=Candidatus Methanogaster sp. ANME-2c ERB4 TaxID=2759911 RepID=A0A7G9YK94_9EURY|nr:hypothetical protein HCMIGFPE_00001 [Methanosarcinales archaeon ANME-2c ERB4]QNO48475.1 hypothetical protein PDFDOJNE_00005 [Methanosarcinales archaeon ANME-2c ERB4]
MTSNKSNQTIDVDEVDHHLIHIYIKSAIESQTEEERKQYLTEALLSYGIRFGYSLNELARMSDQKKYQDLSDEYLDLLVSWLTGKRLTERADEDERRIVLAIESIEGMGEDNSLGRLAASSILKLPLGHPRRDVDMAHQALLNNLGRCSDHGDIEGQVSTITDLVKYKSESKDRTLELIQEGQNLIDQVSDPDIRRNFQIQILGYYIQFAITNRDDGNIQAQKQWTMKAKTIYDQLITENQGNSHYMDKNLYLSALLFEIMEEPAKAAERFASIINSEKHHEGEYHIAAMHEGRLRIVLGEYQRGIEVLEPVVPIFEELYLTAVEDTAVRDAGKDFSKVVTNLAFAHACMGQWQEAVRNLEMGKSLRLRYRKALRESHRGQTILELEKKLYALSRGVSQESERTTDRASDWLGEQISLQSRVLEEYRKQRPVLSSKLLISPSISEIATSLVQDEAVVMMGLSFKGTMIAVICPGDENMPSGHFLFEDWTKGKLAGFLTGGEDEDGWLFANGAPELMIDRQQALDKLIDGFEEAIGKPLGSFLKHKGVHRVTIIPHLWTRLVPFWALPSLVDFDILISPSATNFITSRQSVKVLHHKALIVADPTLDLPVSLAEAEASGQYLASMGWDITQLIKENATEEALYSAPP